MTGSAPVGFDRLAREILAMAEADQRMRGGESGPDPETDRRNASRLRDIVAEIGWPTRSKVGEQAEHMAWLLAQHADHDPAFQRSCLTRMREQAAGEVCAQHLAYLEDRLRVNEKRPQLFGTQFFTDDRGRFAPIR